MRLLPLLRTITSPIVAAKSATNGLSMRFNRRFVDFLNRVRKFDSCRGHP